MDPQLKKAVKAAKKLLAIKEVQGVFVGTKVRRGHDTGEPAIVVYVSRKKPPAFCSQVVPKRVGATQTDVVQSGGPFVAERVLTSAVYPGRYRPAPCGVSFGHKAITAGTLGLWVRDRKGDRRICALTNNHVAANSNNASIGDEILQPAAYDGGTVENDTLGALRRFVPIKFIKDSFLCRFLRRFFGSAFLMIAENRLDFALVDVDPKYIRPEILDQPNWPTAWADAEPGMRVAKTGRTTGYQEGVCTGIAGTANVSYGAAGIARFVDLDAFSNISAGGDSGSGITTEAGRAVVSHLFAGSDEVTLGLAWRNVDGEVELIF